MASIKKIFTMKRLKDIINKYHPSLKVEIYPQEKDMFIITGLPNGKLTASPGAAIEELLRVVRTCKINEKAPVVSMLGNNIIIVPTGEYKVAEGEETHELWAVLKYKRKHKTRIAEPIDPCEIVGLGKYESLWKMMSFLEKKAIDVMVKADPGTMH